MLWGSATLKERSLFGRPCPRHKKLEDHKVKAPLAPAKLNVVRGKLGRRTTASQWDIQLKQKTNSMYIKTLSTMLWGSATLKEHSLFWRPCPRHKKLGGSQGEGTIGFSKADICER